MSAVTAAFPAVDLGGTFNRCQCMQCGEPFNSVSAFDLHQRLGKDGRVVCMMIGQMIVKGMVKNAAGFWVGSIRDDRYGL